MRLSLLTCLLASTLLYSGLRAQGPGDHLTWLQQSGSSLDLVAVAEANPSAQPTTRLSGLELLPLEITNRTTQTSFSAQRSRLVDRYGSRIAELPNGGKLLRYRRSNRQVYGFFQVLPNGHALVLVERSAIAGLDPFEDRIGLAPDGSHAAISTVAGALLLARLDGQNFASSQSPVRSITLPRRVTVEPLSLTPGRTRLYFVTDDDKVRRCEYPDGSQPVDVTPASTGLIRLKDQLALSGDGSTIVFLYGPKGLQSLYLLAETGPARRLPPPPAKYEEPGYLPEAKGGPRLLLNHDASRLMYTDATNRDEIYLLDTSGVTPTTHVSSDHNILPYIGVGILPTFVGGKLTVAIGDVNRFDWFQATTGSAFIQNVTLTGPNAIRPFGAGTLIPQTSFRDKTGQKITTERKLNGEIRARIIRNGQSMILADKITQAPVMGSGFGQGTSVLLHSLAGDLSLRTDNLMPRLVTPPSVKLSTDVTAPSALYSAATFEYAGQTFPFVNLHGIEIIVLPPKSSPVQVVLTKSGGLVLNSGQIRYLAVGVDRQISSPPVHAVLSGSSN